MILIPYSFVQRLDLQYYAVVELEILEQQPYVYHFILPASILHQILFYCEYLLVLVLVLLVLMMLVLMLLLVVVLL